MLNNARQKFKKLCQHNLFLAMKIAIETIRRCAKPFYNVFIGGFIGADLHSKILEDPGPIVFIFIQFSGKFG